MVLPLKPTTMALRILATRSRSAAAIRSLSSSSAVRGGAHHDDHSAPEKLHPEEYLKVAREWPHEELYPGGFWQDTVTIPQAPKHGTNSHGVIDGSDTGAGGRGENFSSPFWTKLLGTLILGVFIYRGNEYLSAGKEVHPLAEFLNSLAISNDKIHAENEKWFAIRKREANDQLIWNLIEKPVIHRVAFPDMFQRASDNLVGFGQDTHKDVKAKQKWQENDELIGAPYPKDS
ncbi:uncharacterized protein BJ171DRAFT_513995 [Polychytrium aggregatum]|uniref:uncharacterized protein n=1 Tax=Polychytrium aggregatum TaxID=110093 RepID=UPI0022FE0F75|nr:uncharacterized protein BJ171DRAFT_513995 [Polychytrium aggregatum]KAI9202415.1 hypothetical protein BJ171DRAFT_513995 [Polychytrium aggregatum]